MYCVIVGDIVNSRTLGYETRERITHAAKSMFDRINASYADSLMAPFGLVRGDAFEGVLITQYHAPQIVQDIIKEFYRVDKTVIRICVVLGQLTVTGHDRNEADGPAFYKALDTLTKMKEVGSNHWLQVSFDIGEFGQPLVESNLKLLAALTERWTDKQREIVWATEKHNGYQKPVGQEFGIAPSVVNKQLKAASYAAYRQAWGSLTEHLIAMDELAVENRSIFEPSYVPYYNIALRKMKQRISPEVLQLLEKSLELAKEELNDNDPQLIHIYTNLASLYSEYAEYGKAKAAIDESLRLQESMPKMYQDIIKYPFTHPFIRNTKKQQEGEQN